MSTIIAPNPLPADIDWKRVENTLGVRIVQGSPGAMTPPLTDDNDPTATSGLDFDDRYRDARRDEDARVLRVRNVDPSRAIAVDRVLDSLEEGGDLLVIVDPKLVRAVTDLVSHVPFSPSVDKSPEPSDIDGVLSGDCFDECVGHHP